MAIKKLQVNISTQDSDNLYKNFYDTDTWSDHRLRITTTASLLSWAIDRYKPTTLADLACGDGKVVFNALENTTHDPKTIILGDLSRENINHVEGLALDPHIKFQIYQKAIEETITSIDKVDILIMTEILEHLLDPMSILDKAREKTKYLLLSTPDGEDPIIHGVNSEHLWSWTRGDILKVLKTKNFNPIVEESIDFEESKFPYKFQIWLAE